MSSLPTTDDLVARNKAHLLSHQPIPTLAELFSSNLIPHIMVVTCADSRCIPENFLYYKTGEAITVRNVGGNIEMALPDILAIDTLKRLEGIMVVKHTDCGSQLYTSEGVKGVLKDRAPKKEREVENTEFGSIAGKKLEQGLREQIGAVRASELVRESLKAVIRAFIFDLANGSLTEVVLED